MQVLERILAVDYHFPSSIPVSEQCKDLLRHILVADPAKRFSISDIQRHPWCAPCLQDSEVLLCRPERPRCCMPVIPSKLSVLCYCEKACNPTDTGRNCSHCPRARAN